MTHGAPDYNLSTISGGGGLSVGVFASTVTYYSDPDAAEHDVFAFNVPGGTLDINKQIWGRIRLLVSNDGVGGRLVTVRLYYNLTSLACVSAALPTAAAFSEGSFLVEFCLSSNANINLQKLYLSGNGNSQGIVGNVNLGGWAAAAVNSTVDQVLKLSIQQNNVAVALKFLSGIAYLG